MNNYSTADWNLVVRSPIYVYLAMASTDKGLNTKEIIDLILELMPSDERYLLNSDLMNLVLNELAQTQEIASIEPNSIPELLESVKQVVETGEKNFDLALAFKVDLLNLALNLSFREEEERFLSETDTPSFDMIAHCLGINEEEADEIFGSD